MPIQGEGMSDQRAESQGGGEMGITAGVCWRGGGWRHRGRGVGEVWGRREGGEASVSCSPNSLLLSAEQVHKASLEGVRRGAAG